MSSQYPDRGFRITTTRLSAVVDLTQGESLEGAFSCAGPSTGTAELSDLLNHPTAFVPFFARGRDAPILLGKHAIRVVRLDRACDAGSLDEFGEARELSLLLDDGTELRGEITISAPIGHTRTLDSLNEAGRFLVVRTASHVLLVNRTAIVVCADVG